MSLFDLQDVCIVIGSLATLDSPMVVDLIGIYVLKGPYCTLTMTDWFFQTLSVIPRGSWGDVARRFTMIRWYGPFNPYIPIGSTTIGKSRVSIDPIAMHTSWRSNSDIASVTSIGYPRMSASGESSTTMHQLLHASGSHPIPTPYDPKTNQYNQDLGLNHSTNGNHLESPKEGSSIDHQITIYLHAQNITMFPTNETWPKNLKFQNRPKTGPTSCIGPKTSRAARDRPEPKPRRIQPSRNRRSGGRPAAPPRNHARRKGACGQRSHRCATIAQQASTKRRLASPTSSSGRPQLATSSSAQPRANIGRPSCNERHATSAAEARDKRGRRTAELQARRRSPSATPMRETHATSAPTNGATICAGSGQQARHCAGVRAPSCAGEGATAGGGGRWLQLQFSLFDLKFRDIDTIMAEGATAGGGGRWLQLQFSLFDLKFRDIDTIMA
ncbi:hypothetical protein F511_20404 [Dorcoceras hygrometricum]|uniref:Uncharacterized protein n=1 Tax=Dorcoceras hygrometricum TaxID=472368 RepID=A0A2Z7BW69_9LAMI|nr:hypothetical protein F511_20404 [Dorcoceras hygrometricum]